MSLSVCQLVFYIVGVDDDKNSLLDYYDIFSYPSLVVILNRNIRNEHYDENL